MTALVRKGFLWVESDAGERVQVTGRHRLEYQDGQGVYCLEVEPSWHETAVYAGTLRRTGEGLDLSGEERAKVLARVLELLRFSQDPFLLVV